MPRTLDVGEQVIGSSHQFDLTLPFNQGGAGVAAVDLSVAGSPFFAAHLEKKTIEESGSITGGKLREQFEHPISVRFSPTERGSFDGVLTLRASWADAHIEEQQVRLVGTARELTDAPSESRSTLGQRLREERDAEEQHAMEQARYADTDWRAAHTPDGPRADFDDVTALARTAAENVAHEQNLALSTVEKEVGTFKAPPTHQPLWLDLAETALSIATAGVAEVVAKKLALAIGKALMESAHEKSPLVTSLSGMIKEQLKAAGHKAIASLPKKGSEREISSAERIAFFEEQGKALARLQHENAKVIDERAKYLRPLLSADPGVATKTMKAVADTFDSSDFEAGEIQKGATTAQWLVYRARLANGTDVVGTTTVTELGKARPAHPSNAPEQLIGVLDLRVDIDNGVRVRSAYARGLAQAAAANLETINLGKANIPLRLVLDGNSGAPVVITRDEAGRVRASGDLSKLARFNGSDGAPADETQAERAARNVCDSVIERNLANWGVQIITDDHAGRAA